jgi:hypothetical protein
MRVLGANAILGGASAALAALVRGDAVLEAFANGAGGGALLYAGKRIAVGSWPGAGFVGRQVTSVGGSIIGNEVSGRGPLDRIAFAAGPLRAYVGPEVSGVHWRLDVPAVVGSAWFWIRGAEPDLGKSLSSGALVFRGEGEGSLPGTIVYTTSRNPDRVAYVLAHERVHVLQYDHSFLAWGDPFEGWLAQRFPSLRGTLDRLEFNVPVLATTILLSILVWEEHADQP